MFVVFVCLRVCISFLKFGLTFFCLYVSLFVLFVGVWVGIWSRVVRNGVVREDGVVCVWCVALYIYHAQRFGYLFFNKVPKNTAQT